MVSPRAGYVSSVDSMEIGLVGVLLGAGRRTVDESVDFAASVLFRKKAGTLVQEGDVLAEVYTERKRALEDAEKRVLGAFSFSDAAMAVPPLITNFATKDGVEPFNQPTLARQLIMYSYCKCPGKVCWRWESVGDCEQYRQCFEDCRRVS